MWGGVFPRRPTIRPKRAAKRKEVSMVASTKIETLNQYAADNFHAALITVLGVDGFSSSSESIPQILNLNFSI